ncbi:MAG: hypothetical protein UT61_C0025G0017 [Candidatus Woesebacteria bacterium GW2011_GWA1_39_8]|uniref:Uncharacterized protein n=1 Tax=Candidatus Woesebacteria bacterium GW2011_GWA1_39_8 TaxID=1618552 RepID=A0A0G0S4R1_9BACT|nr:MAG: hypothetical protein UT61_C0025G0017 [Candidatus Woesebacteria bacterium GW2011_GWA1_39_8]
MTHNFRQNWHNASGVQNVQMKRDILLSEIAKKITYDKERIITALRESGFSIPADVNERGLTKMVASALSRSKKFATKLTDEILLSADGFYSADKDKKKPIDWGQAIKGAGDIIKGIGNIFGGTSRAEADKAAAEAAKAQAEKELADKVGGLRDSEKTSDNTWIWWLVGGLSAAAIAGFTIWYITKK